MITHCERWISRLGLLLAMILLTGCERESVPSGTPAHSPPVESIRAEPAARLIVEAAEPSSRHPSPEAEAEDAADAPSPSPDNAEAMSPRLRPENVIPEISDGALDDAGIRVYRSKYLTLYTDIDPEDAAPLPRLVDAIYPQWEAYFGELPKGVDGSDLHLVGHIMRAPERFVQAGLVPPSVPEFAHGLHRGNRFWMHEQGFDYYQRHLLLHEATHCFMTILPEAIGPVWYLEGMAELFATHRYHDDGTLETRVLPDDREAFAGWGRITLVREDVAQGRLPSTRDVMQIPATEYDHPRPYAWSWALCQFLDAHPHYREGFHRLARRFLHGEFQPALEAEFLSQGERGETDWLLTATALQYGFDFETAAAVWEVETTELEPGEATSLDVAANRGWHATGVRVQAGHWYRTSAAGEATLATEPRPWRTEPQGITYTYFDGRPLGELTALVVPDGGAARPSLPTLPLGRHRIFQPPLAGELFVRINDDWSELSDNTGGFTVTIERVSSPVE